MADNWTVSSLFEELKQLDEHQRIEAKRSTHIGSSVMQSVCAFANEMDLGGGWILLGVCEPDDNHPTFWIEGIEEPDKLLNDLQSNCRSQFSAAIQLRSKVELIDGKKVIAIFVSELPPAAKPCGFIGKPDKKNKKKTGVWGRGINGDYELTQDELTPMLQAKNGQSYDKNVLPELEWDDLDPQAITQYRNMRARVRPHAEELQATDEEMLRALNLATRVDGQYRPTIAGLLLLGRPLSLRRLMPMVRVDYVRISGTQWVEDGEQRFEATLDFRDALIRLIPRLEATILDDMPRHFQLVAGNTQRSDKPMVPQKVVREAVVNAVMHRDYQKNQPTIVVRYSNRIEIRNAGYSLKPELELGEMGSVQRNPNIASVLYDLELAETKGSGIGTMRRLLDSSGLSAPLFVSDRDNNQFTATYLLHQFMGEEQLRWLAQFSRFNLTDDEAKALVLAREVGAVDNASVRAIAGIDSSAASRLLKKLATTYGLLNKHGDSRATYYNLNIEHSLEVQLTNQDVAADISNLGVDTSNLGVDTSNPSMDTSNLGVDTSNPSMDTSNLGSNPSKQNAVQPSPFVLNEIDKLSTRPRKEALKPLILALCASGTLSAEELAKIFGRKERAFQFGHLNPLLTEGLLEHVHPVPNHPAQAYQISASGKHWLQQHNPALCKAQDN